MPGSTLPDHPALVVELFAVIDAADFARAASLLDDAFQMHYHGIPDPIAKATLLDMIRDYFEIFPDMRHEVLHVLPSGDCVTLRMVTYATHRAPYEGIAATGRQVAVPAIHVLRLANGKVVEWWAAEDDLGLLRQLGAVVVPPPAAAGV